MNTIKISRGLVNPTNPSDHEATNIRLTLTPSAIRQNKYDFASGSFDAGFPFNRVYYFCKQNLTSIFKYGSLQYSRNPNNKVISIISGYNNINLCNNTPPLCTKSCPQGQTLDPVSCSCVPITECIPQPECTPLPIPIELKNTIKGYAYYLTSPRTVPVPGIGLLPVTCWGGHACCTTNFHPTIITSDNISYLANRPISMNNYARGPDQCSIDGQIPTEGFNPANQYERSDTFEFDIPDPSVLMDSQFYLECLLPGGCHSGVTMVFLVGETLDGDSILLFSSCVLPSIEGAKSIGTVDCDTESDSVPCNPPPPPPPSPTPTEPPCTKLSESTSINVSMPQFDWDPNVTNDPFYTIVNNIMRDTYTLNYPSQTYIETFNFGGTQLELTITFYSSPINGTFILQYSLVQPANFSIPGGLWVATSTGYLYNTDFDQCSLTLSGSMTNGIGIGNSIVGPILVSASS